MEDKYRQFQINFKIRSIKSLCTPNNLHPNTHIYTQLFKINKRKKINLNWPITMNKNWVKRISIDTFIPYILQKSIEPTKFYEITIEHETFTIDIVIEKLECLFNWQNRGTFMNSNVLEWKTGVHQTKSYVGVHS